MYRIKFIEYWVLSLVWGTLGDFEQTPLQVKRKPAVHCFDMKCKEAQKHLH